MKHNQSLQRENDDRGAYDGEYKTTSRRRLYKHLVKHVDDVCSVNPKDNLLHGSIGSLLS